MTFKPRIWFPIAVILTALNVVAVAVPAPVMPLHAMTHGALAVGFGLWAQRLWRRRREGGEEARVESVPGETESRLDALESEVSSLRQELVEAQERIDFAERLLARRPETGHVGPQR